MFDGFYYLCQFLFHRKHSIVNFAISSAALGFASLAIFSFIFKNCDSLDIKLATPDTASSGLLILNPIPLSNKNFVFLASWPGIGAMAIIGRLLAKDSEDDKPPTLD